LLGAAESGTLDGYQQARVDLLRAHVAFVSGAGRDTPTLLLDAADRLTSSDPALARETYLTAWSAANYAGNHPRGDLVSFSRAVLALDFDPAHATALDLLLRGLALLQVGGHTAAAPMLRQASQALLSIPPDDVLRWGWQATSASDAIWDNDASVALAERATELTRSAGALSQLVLSLTPLGNAAMRRGDFLTAKLHIAEAESISIATGTRHAPYTAMRLLALQGNEREATALISATLERADADGQRLPVEVAHWAAAILGNGLGRYDDAVRSARLAASDASGPFVSSWVLPELIEAAVRSGNINLGREAMERLAATTQVCATDWALGIEARCWALLESGDVDARFQASIDLLGRARLRPEAARSHLLYGEWLRREGRRLDAREQLREAHDMFAAIGMEAFGERARRELTATGGKARKRSDDTRDQLTPQEEQIARLARDGLTNPEVGATLFLSPRTVEWHLRNVFTKLGINSRNGLHDALSPPIGDGLPR
jgi:ATP/maltotriose-dependent transcriptional regulator MalT